MDESPFDRIMQTSNANNEWSAKQASIQRDWQESMFNKQMDFNSAQAKINRDWQKELSDTSHQREIVDLQKAGLNPILSGTGGNGASVGTGAAASIGGVPSGAKGDTDESSTGAIASYLAQMLAAETSIRNTEVSAEAARAGSELMAAASEYGAMMSAGAMNYSANLSLQNNREQREWNTLHPSNPYQLAGTLAGAAGIGVPSVQVVNSAIQQAHDQGQTKVKELLTKGVNWIKGIVQKGHNFAMKHKP